MLDAGENIRPGGAEGVGGVVCRRERFVHGATAFDLLVPARADELIDEEAFAADERLPYWADLWPSAKALARFVLDASSETLGIEGRGRCRAIELGCGVGLVALALGRRGVDVAATDYEPAALRMVEANAALNALAAGGAPAISTRHVDWRSPPDELAPAALVVAADVLYEERHVEALARMLRRAVEPGGRALIADPGRRWLEPFVVRLRGAGWSVQDVAVVTEPGTASGSSPSAVRIVRAAFPASP